MSKDNVSSNPPGQNEPDTDSSRPKKDLAPLIKYWIDNPYAQERCGDGYDYTPILLKQIESQNTQSLASSNSSTTTKPLG